VCARCRLPLGSPSPLPPAAIVLADAAAALDAYAAVLRDHPWATEARTRLPRAPEPLAAPAAAVLAWTPAHGSAALLAALDDAVLAWLTRDTRPAGARRVADLHTHLAAHDLTLAEARTTVTTWLDPDGTLGTRRCWRLNEYDSFEPRDLAVMNPDRYPVPACLARTPPPAPPPQGEGGQACVFFTLLSGFSLWCSPLRLGEGQGGVRARHAANVFALGSFGEQSAVYVSKSIIRST